MDLSVLQKVTGRVYKDTETLMWNSTSLHDHDRLTVISRILTLLKDEIAVKF